MSPLLQHGHFLQGFSGEQGDPGNAGGRGEVVSCWNRSSINHMFMFMLLLVLYRVYLVNLDHKGQLETLDPRYVYTLPITPIYLSPITIKGIRGATGTIGVRGPPGPKVCLITQLTQPSLTSDSSL